MINEISDLCVTKDGNIVTDELKRNQRENLDSSIEQIKLN